MEKITVSTIESYVECYSRLIFSICYSTTHNYFDAEDLTQETFLSACRSFQSFDGGNIKAWLTKIALNKCRDYLKSASRRSIPSDTAGELIPAPDDPEREVVDRLEFERLRSLCDGLREPYRTVVTAHLIAGMSVPEIAERTSTNPKTVHTRLQRARDMLKMLWKEGKT